MVENFVGYVLDALDAEERQAVEKYLVAHPEAKPQFEALKRALAPLEDDRDPGEPPPGLAVRTIGFVAEYLVRNRKADPPSVRPAEAALAEPRNRLGSADDLPLPLAAAFEDDDEPRTTRPAPPPEPPASVPAWRRPDALMAAGLLVAVLGLGLPTLSAIQTERQKLSCQNNLRQFWGEAFQKYQDQDKESFPFVREGQEVRAFLPIMAKDFMLPATVNLTCPVEGYREAPPVNDIQTKTVEELTASNQLSTAYAYSLGYRDGGNRLQPLRPRTDDNAAFTPIMADRPAPSGGRLLHGNGMNVLFLGGNVRFCTAPNVGVDADDIYQNRNGQVKAGVDRDDAVLATGIVTP
jgi:prepilin-type processing-associated H-X9-DG protein